MIFRHSFDRKFGRVHGRQIVKLTPTPITGHTDQIRPPAARQHRHRRTITKLIGQHRQPRRLPNRLLASRPNKPQRPSTPIRSQHRHRRARGSRLHRRHQPRLRQHHTTRHRRHTAHQRRRRASSRTHRRQSGQSRHPGQPSYTRNHSSGQRPQQRPPKGTTPNRFPITHSTTMSITPAMAYNNPTAT